MIRLPDIALPDEAAQGLRGYQAEVDGKPDYAAQVEAGKQCFSAHNRRGNKVFDAVKAALDQMCSGAGRCVYCEDSLADELEHGRPKDLYPDHVFRWPNYLYACGPCNGPKNNQFAVFPSGTADFVEVSRKRGDPILPPTKGDPVLLDPRREDATRWMMLDLAGTFLFRPIASPGTRDHARAMYTIKVLGLNRREALLRARKQAFVGYLNFLHRYLREKQARASVADREETIAQLRRAHHPTVWREMQRQHDKLPALAELFAAAPEALSW